MSGIFINKKTHQVIALEYDEFATTSEVLSPYLSDDCLPEGVHKVALYVDHKKLPHLEYHIDEFEANKVPEGVAEVTESLVLYDHSGLSIQSLPLKDNEGAKGWDLSRVGYISVRADTKETAKKYLKTVVNAWDDFLVFGRVEAALYSSMVSYAVLGESEEICIVDSSEIEDNQVFQAAQALGINGTHDDWVKLYFAGSDVMLNVVKEVLDSTETAEDEKWSALVEVVEAFNKGR